MMGRKVKSVRFFGGGGAKSVREGGGPDPLTDLDPL